jgi:hypothetical protein
MVNDSVRCVNGRSPMEEAADGDLVVATAVGRGRWPGAGRCGWGGDADRCRGRRRGDVPPVAPGRFQSSLIARWRRSVESEDGQWPLVGAEGCRAESRCDVGVASGAELVDGEAAQGGHVLRAVSGAASSRKAVSRTKWSLFSITRCALKIFAIPTGSSLNPVVVRVDGRPGWS